MIDICKFGPGLARGGNTLMLGGNDRKAASFRALVEAWAREFPDDALIVLDHSGRLYASYDGEAALANRARI